MRACMCAHVSACVYYVCAYVRMFTFEIGPVKLMIVGISPYVCEN